MKILEQFLEHNKCLIRKENNRGAQKLECPDPMVASYFVDAWL